jgi:glycosyltransferase involved in cell wall biosynthesis
MVSVVIPTYNRLAFLKEAIASISTQDYVNRETIVVDDACEDGTWEWLSSLRDPRVRTFRLQQHAERSAARNLGLSSARGEFVLFLDDDDLLAPGALSSLSAAAQRQPRALAAVGGRISFDGSGRWYRPPHPRWTFTRKIWPDILFGWIPSQGQTLIRKDALLTAGGWNEAWNVAEDHELWLRLVSDDSVLVFVPGIVKKMRIHSGQTSTRGSYQASVKLRRDFVRRLPSHLQKPGWKIIRSERLHSIAGAFLARSDYRKAAVYYLRSAAETPQLLARPVPALLLLGGSCRALVGLFFGRGLFTFGSKMKALLRGLQKDRLALPSSCGVPRG